MSNPLIGRLGAIPRLRVETDVLLSQYTRFAIGGAADIYVETSDETAFISALQQARASHEPWVVIGSGTNLIVADEGFRGTVLRFTASSIQGTGNSLSADAGASLQSLVDASVDRGLARIHTMTGIPGTVGAAVYGNAGAYGHSISESVRSVRFFDGNGIRTIDNAGCQFAYRESRFKQYKEWIIFSTTVELEPGDHGVLRAEADKILETRNHKYPPDMKCAGSIFKNLLFALLPAAVQSAIPPSVVREGKVPSAWFLEQAGAKGIRNGGIHVADYHANLIYNAGGGTARELVEVIRDLKNRVSTRFRFQLEEEVQYVGFTSDSAL